MSQVAFLFPGQGAQTVGMGRVLCESLPAARALFEEAAGILGYDLAALCANGPAEELNSTAKSQPAIFVASLAALESLRAREPAVLDECRATAGLSLGEYTALVFAGALSFQDGLRLVQRRGEAMQAAADARPSGMVSVVGVDVEQAKALCAQARGSEILEIANLLCPGNIVLSGTKAACDEVEKAAEKMGARTIRLQVAGAFHTELMKPAEKPLASALAEVEFRPLRIPVWTNVDAQPHSRPDEIRRLLLRQVLEPVLWEQTLRNLLASGCDKFYEIGPGRVLTGLLKRVHRKADCQNVNS
jgi:[acyl-carrier-protein] S-malonyltransferase